MKKVMKKVIAAMVSTAMLLPLAACGRGLIWACSSHRATIKEHEPIASVAAVVAQGRRARG